MIARIFEIPGFLIVVCIAVLAFAIAFIVGTMRGGPRVARAVEAAVLALLGGLLSRAFLSVLLAAADDSSSAGLAVGWGFFLVPGLIDTFAGKPLLTTPEMLLLFGGVIGAFTGMMGGIYSIYDWTGLGWISFPLDVTWALAGNTVGALLHLVNIGWGDHGSEVRENVHRYARGFGLRYSPRYAFTQGCVMSNLADPPGADLYRHERTHVWQNRAFGPLYTLTYVGWMLVWVIPSVIAGIAVLGITGVVKGPNNWCYFNNPWEAWAYAVQGAERTNIDGVSDGDRKMIWPARFVVAWAIPFFVISVALSVFMILRVWGSSPSSTHDARAQVPVQAAVPSRARR